MKKVKVAINGYGVIGKRLADAISIQDDMEIVGICDVITDWRIHMALKKKYPVYAASAQTYNNMVQAGIAPAGVLNELIQKADIIIDCTPKKISALNVPLYKEANKKFIVQGGDKHETTGHSFNAETNFTTAIDRNCTRVVSCNTTSILRVMGALKRGGILKSARGTLLRRATDAWESHQTGIMNTLVPEQKIPSHQGPDAQSVDPTLDIITAAVMVPETLSHLHYWNINLSKSVTKNQVLEIIATNSSRIAFVNYASGLMSNNTIKEFLSDIGRPRADMYEVALWVDMLTVVGDELFLAYIVDNQAIVIPETIDAIRALIGLEQEAIKSILKTNNSLAISANIFNRLS